MNSSSTRSTIMRSTVDKLLFFTSRLALYSLAEAAYLLGNLLPTRAAIFPWRLALSLNRHHSSSALNLALAARDDADGWAAFLTTVEAIRNPWNTSGSDLFLTWVPGRLVQRFYMRLLFGRLTDSTVLNGAYDEMKKVALAHLAAYHTRQALAQKQTERAGQALAIWSSVAGDMLEIRWAKVEVAVMKSDPTA